MIKKAMVRRRPMTGVGQGKRHYQGIVYLEGSWISSKVVVMKDSDYRVLMLEIAKRQRRINKATKILK